MYRPRLRVFYQALAFVAAAPGIAGAAYAATSAQVHNKTVIYEDRTSYAETPAAVVETITADKWFSQFATPVRRRQLADQQDFAQAPHTPFALAWAKTLDTPVRRKDSQHAQQAHRYQFFLPGTAEAIGWHYPLEVPTRRKSSGYTQQWLGYAYFLPVVAEEVTVDKWFEPLTTPVRRFRTQQIAFGYSNFTPTAAAPGDATLAFGTSSWQVASKTIVYEPDAYTPFTPAAELITIDKWWRELAVPVRRKPQAFQLSHTFVAAAPGAGVTYNWFTALETPTRARKLREYPATAIPVYFVPETPGPGFELNWWPPLTEPVRPKRYVAAQQGLTVPPALLTVTLEYAWHSRLTEPTRLKRRLGYDPFIAVSYQAALVEIVTVDKWFRELDRPIYRKRVDRPALAQGNVNPVVPYAWHQLHAPLRIKGRIEYPAFTRPIFPFAFPGPGVGLNQPWPALSEPVRFSARIRPGQQQFRSAPSLAIDNDLDPACRVYEVLEFSGIVQSEGDQDVVPVGDADLVVDGDEDLTPEPGATIKVEC